MTNPLRSRVLQHIKEAGLFDSPGHALLAVSGGTDSVALLDLMVSAAPHLGLDVAVAHVAHGIQEETAAVVPRVADLAALYSVPFYVEELGLGPDAGETIARRERYRALRHVQSESGARYLVTAHHRDDQQETILYRFLRGSGLAGLAGIPSVGPDGLVRPLLPFGRNELADWIEKRSSEAGFPVELFDDPANTDRRYDRVWIRHEVLPCLRERFGPVVEQRLLDVGNHATRDNAAWAGVLRELPGLDFREDMGLVEVARAPLDRYDKVLAEGLLRALCREVGCLLGAKRAELLLSFVRRSSSGRILQLGDGWEATLVFDKLRIYKDDGDASEDGLEAAACEGSEGQLVWGKWEFSWQSQAAQANRRDSRVAWITPGTIRVRGPKPGDRILPLGGIGHRSVRRVLMEARVPAQERNVYPVVVRGDEVLWIPGVCLSADAVAPIGEMAVLLEAHADG